jgi:TPR repeat protein
MSRGGVAQDFAKAYEYLEKAAIAKDAEAQYILGVMLTQGQGPTGKPEKTQAFSWFEKSASQGKRATMTSKFIHCIYSLLSDSVRYA